MNNNLKGFDPEALYLKEEFMDLTAGSIWRLTPVDVDRKRDDKRKVRYLSNIVCAVGNQSVTVGFEIEADSFAQAVDKWLSVAEEAAQAFAQQQVDRERTSRLIAPASARMPVN